MHLIMGNLFSLFATMTDSFSSTRKTTKSVLLVQCGSQVFYFISSLILGGYSACAQNVVSVLRNFAAIRNINKKWVEWSLIALGVVLGIFFNNLGFMGLLPVIANLEYSLAIFRFKDNERALKISFLFAVILFIIFNFVIWNFVGVICNAIIAVTILIFLFKK